MDEEAQALLKQGNKQTLDQMEAAMPKADPCSAKHEAMLLPFAKRTFELMEMQANSQNVKKAVVTLPTPWGKMEMTSQDFLRVVMVALIGWVVWLNMTDKQERQQVIQEIRTYRQATAIQAPDKVTMVNP